jgi:hypothetical protein
MLGMNEIAEMLRLLAICADRDHDGHVSIMKFTSNWRVGFGTPFEAWGYTTEDIPMRPGDTFIEAARRALAAPHQSAVCISNPVAYPDKRFEFAVPDGKAIMQQLGLLSRK